MSFWRALQAFNPSSVRWVRNGCVGSECPSGRLMRQFLSSKPGNFVSYGSPKRIAGCFLAIRQRSESCPQLRGTSGANPEREGPLPISEAHRHLRFPRFA